MQGDFGGRLHSIDVVITSAGNPSSAEVIAACQAYIDTVGPAGADIWVFTPAVITVDLHLRLKLQAGFTLVDLQGPSESAAAGVIDPLVPLETLYILRLTAAFSSLAGVIDLQLVTPVSNVSASDDPSTVSWIRVGTTTLEAMA